MVDSVGASGRVSSSSPAAVPHGTRSIASLRLRSSHPRGQVYLPLLHVQRCCRAVALHPPTIPIALPTLFFCVRNISLCCCVPAVACCVPLVLTLPSSL